MSRGFGAPRFGLSLEVGNRLEGLGHSMSDLDGKTKGEGHVRSHTSQEFLEGCKN